MDHQTQLQIAKLERENKFYIKEIARIQKEYARLVKKYNRSQKDLKKVEVKLDSQARPERLKSEKTTKRGPRGWPI